MTPRRTICLESADRRKFMLTLFGSGRPNAWASAYGPAGGHLGTLSDISDDDVEKFANELLEALQAKREGRMMSETDNA